MAARHTASQLVEASEALVADNPIMTPVLAEFGPCRFGPKPRVDERFARLARSIAGQQLSVTAASTIFGRVSSLLGFVTAETVLSVEPGQLRACGLSNAKVAAFVDLAERIAAGSVDLASLGRRSDADVVETLTAVRGIGRWTAQMFLLGSLHRLDVWPTGDVGVRNGFAQMMGLDRVPTTLELEQLGERFRPHRSVVAWYCWRVLDSEPID